MKTKQFNGRKGDGKPTERLINEFIACFELSNAKNQFECFSNDIRKAAAESIGAKGPSIYTGNGYWDQASMVLAEGWPSIVMRATMVRTIAFNQYKNGKLKQKSFFGFTYWVKA